MEEIIRLIDAYLADRSAFLPREVVDLLLDVRSIAADGSREAPSLEDYEAALAGIAA